MLGVLEIHDWLAISYLLPTRKFQNILCEIFTVTVKALTNNVLFVKKQMTRTSSRMGIVHDRCLLHQMRGKVT